MNIPMEFAAFPTRESRSRFVAERFAPYLKGSVLDVGCFEAPLRAILPNTEYVGVDMAGNPDVELNLETCNELPFADGRFACVICIEVLEHLDTLHRLFDQLIRVSRKHVIVSLPNCWRDAMRPIGRGKGRFGHYGLPVERPMDRHKWFFSFTEARDFLIGQAAKHDLHIAEMFTTEKPRSALVRQFRRFRYPGDRYRNRYSQNIWVVLEKAGW